MSVSSIAAGSALQAGGTSKQPNEVGKEDFLKLLVTQLAQQDPMNPQDGTQFVAQLAQFTSLERMMNVERGLNNVALAATATNSTLATSFIGKSVRFEGNVVSLAKDGTPTLRYELHDQAATASVTIRDKNGQAIRNFEVPRDKGSQSVVWDGKRNDGNVADEGTYTFSIEAKDDKGNPLGVETQAVAMVTKINFEKGYAELVLDAKGADPIALGQVIEVENPKN